MNAFSKPKEDSVNSPWEIRDCICDGPSCEVCDGWTWFYLNTDTGQTVSEMMRGAMERHG